MSLRGEGKDRKVVRSTAPLKEGEERLGTEKNKKHLFRRHGEKRIGKF